MKKVTGGNEMRVRLKMGMEVALCAALAALASAAQNQGGADPAPRVLVSASVPALDRIVREIDDPHTGAHWLLMRDLRHPGGPGRLVQLESTRHQTLSKPAQAGLAEKDIRPIIHAGERLIVEESTPVVEARLEAVALGPAAVGSPFDVRLTIGGKVLRAVALAPGRAMLQIDSGGRP